MSTANEWVWKQEWRDFKFLPRKIGNDLYEVAVPVYGLLRFDLSKLAERSSSTEKGGFCHWTPTEATERCQPAEFWALVSFLVPLMKEETRKSKKAIYKYDCLLENVEEFSGLSWVLGELDVVNEKFFVDENDSFVLTKNEIRNYWSVSHWPKEVSEYLLKDRVLKPTLLFGHWLEEIEDMAGGFTFSSIVGRKGDYPVVRALTYKGKERRAMVVDGTVVLDDQYMVSSLRKLATIRRSASEDLHNLFGVS